MFPTFFLVTSPTLGDFYLRIFTGFLIMFCSVILWLLPIPQSVYDYRTDPRTDTFSITTGLGVTSGSAVLRKPIYDDDIMTLVFSSNNSGDSPLYSSYNTTSRLVDFTGLAANTTRALEITYDINALESNGALENMAGIEPWLYYIILILFPIAGLIYIFWEKWFG